MRCGVSDAAAPAWHAQHAPTAMRRPLVHVPSLREFAGHTLRNFDGVRPLHMPACSYDRRGGGDSRSRPPPRYRGDYEDDAPTSDAEM